MEDAVDTILALERIDLFANFHVMPVWFFCFVNSLGTNFHVMPVHSCWQRASNDAVVISCNWYSGWKYCDYAVCLGTLLLFEWVKHCFSQSHCWNKNNGFIRNHSLAFHTGHWLEYSVMHLSGGSSWKHAVLHHLRPGQHWPHVPVLAGLVHQPLFTGRFICQCVSLSLPLSDWFIKLAV